jgi:hypothetical protein
MKHPDEADLALFAGHDLDFVSKWRVGRHVARCERCRAEVDAFGLLRSDVAALGELPADIGWNRLASEMKANIRLGLSAGECVAGHGARDNESKLPAFSGGHTLLAYAGLIALVVAGVWLQRPAPRLADLAAAAVQENGGSVVAASGNGIQLTEGGRGLGLRYGARDDDKSFRDVNYSADASGAMGARYVDTSTGYVTVVNVNVE